MRKLLSEASWKTTVAGAVALAAVIGAILIPDKAVAFLTFAAGANAAVGVLAKDHK